MLADELNRSSPKTQGALLEAMAEATVTVDGATHRLAQPFFVIATQNPLEFQGVYPLAESQLDRFMVHLTVDTPAKQDEMSIYRRGPSGAGEAGAASTERGGLLDLDDVARVRELIALIHLEESVLEYAVDLVRATRGLPDASFGVSVRGGLQLIALARSVAFLRGRDFVTPADVADVAVPALAHRICFADGGREIEHRREVVRELLEKIRAPR